MTKIRIRTALPGPSPGIEIDGVGAATARLAPPPRFALVGARELRLMRIIRFQNSLGPTPQPPPAARDSARARGCRRNPSAAKSAGTDSGFPPAARTPGARPPPG